MKAILILLAAAVVISGWGETIGMQEGSDVIVALCAVSRIDADTLRERFPGAPDGLQFTFVVIKKGENPEAKFGLKEPAGFQLDGRAYQLIGEPHTVVQNLDTVSDRMDEWALAEFAGRRGLVVVTQIAGEAIPSDANVEMPVTFAWGGAPERFVFKLSHPR